jgi:hypothetical protein
VSFQLDHRHITDPATQERLRDSYVYGIIGRPVGNIVLSVVYAFLAKDLPGREVRRFRRCPT